ncbi:hypothetical protein O181_090724 [Austropuccinia psidii MF-1]|uniref:Uncharacterized protein n=1 Tax=Austropuccinia psidii MF-1 TaxID=1389203 RepID=A0A9Q3IVZ5_9BASI|nr:hypothetical protein [Austropuccinia psidii MF-1]
MKENWKKLQKKFKNREVLPCLEGTWLPLKEYYVPAWTNHHCHLGVGSTSRVEGDHAMVKLWLQTSTGTLLEVVRALHMAVFTTTKNDPPLLVLRKFQPETKLGPISHTISLWPIRPPSGALWHFSHITLPWPSMAPTIIYGLRPYPAIIGLLGQFPYPQPPGLYLCLWAWGSCVPWPSSLFLGQHF